MSSTVTIERAYLDTLLRRAKYATEPAPITDEAYVPSVTISQYEYEKLTQRSREYDRLRQALFRGGIGQDILGVLIQEPSNDGDESISSRPITHANGESPENGTKQTQFPSVHFTITRPWSNTGERESTQEDGTCTSEHAPGLPRNSRAVPPGFNFDDDGVDKSGIEQQEPGNTLTFSPASGQKKTFLRQDKRSVFVTNLSERTSHRDLLATIRGGAVLDIFLRNDRTASIAFVEGSSAKAFMDYVKRNDIYIHDKRVEFRWADRHFTLPLHVANKISNGATRNILLRNVPDAIDEARIREDLEHIYNLIIVDIHPSKPSPGSKMCNFLICTNSVHNAIFARTCMMSRGTYRGLQIEWAADECAGSLPVLQPRVRPNIGSSHNSWADATQSGFVARGPGGRRKDQAPVWNGKNGARGNGAKAPPMINRFDLLGIDGSDSDDDDVKDGRISGVELTAKAPAFVPANVRTGQPDFAWPENGITA